jgi:3-methylfumaryl-CoA hydratase
VSEFAAWIGRESVRRDIATPAPMQGLAALLDRSDGNAKLLPPLAHWLYFLPDAPQATLGPDGHPILGADMPALGLPRRMWAGSRIAFRAPIEVGSEMTRRTRIQSINMKQGSSGSLAFVTLRHEIVAAGETAIIEEQDIVYREAAGGRPTGVASTAQVETPAGAIMTRRSIDPVFLFRFSALTFNAHRIHYDRDFARDIEGYPGLVVHGPLQAMLLIDLYRNTFPRRAITDFTFRAQAPLFEGEEAIFGLEPTETGGTLWTRTGGGQTMAAAISARA